MRDAIFFCNFYVVGVFLDHRFYRLDGCTQIFLLIFIRVNPSNPNVHCGSISGLNFVVDFPTYFLDIQLVVKYFQWLFPNSSVRSKLR